jgi:hypothetical protein
LARLGKFCVCSDFSSRAAFGDKERKMNKENSGTVNYRINDVCLDQEAMDFLEHQYPRKAENTIQETIQSLIFNVMVARLESIPPQVTTVEVNGVQREIAPGTYRPSGLRELFSIADTMQISQVVNGAFRALDAEQSIQIVGGERFVSHVSVGGSI